MGLRKRDGIEMIFRYNIGDEYHDEWVEWELEDEGKICNAIEDILSKEYDLDKKKLGFLLSDMDLYSYVEDYLQDELQDYFEDEAKGEYQEGKRELNSRYN